MPIVASPMALVMALGSGLASAVLFASVVGGTMLAVPLFALTALPLVIVALGWGTAAALLAALIGSGTIFVAFSAGAAGVYLGQAALPAILTAHLTGLARDAGGRAEWYPLGRVITAGALAMAALAVVGGLVFGFSEEDWTRQIAASLAAMFQAQDGAAGTPEQLRAEVAPVARVMARLLPILLPALWTLILVLNLWLGAKVVARSERLARPWEDLGALDLPRGAALLFGASLVATVLPAPIGSLAAPFLGALGAVHMLVGLAVLHTVTRGSAARPIVLATVYGLVFLFTFPALVLVLIGLLEPVMRFRDRRRGGPPAIS